MYPTLYTYFWFGVKIIRLSAGFGSRHLYERGVQGRRVSLIELNVQEDLGPLLEGVELEQYFSSTLYGILQYLAKWLVL